MRPLSAIATFAVTVWIATLGVSFCFAVSANATDEPRLTVAARREVERTKHHDDPVIQQALIVLDQPLNPVIVVCSDEIRAIYARSPGARMPAVGLIAFRAPGDLSDAAIYLNCDSVVYTEATQKPSPLVLLKVAATLVHEQVHNTDDDAAAYRLQADFIRSKLRSLPSGQLEETRKYLQGLEARANVLARIARSLAVRQ